MASWFRSPALHQGGVLVLRLVLAGVIGVAGAVKLPDPQESVRAVRAYRLLPEAVVPAVGYGLPLLELAVALLLLAGLATRLAASVAALLMVAFIVGVSSAATRGLSIDCGCFGGGGDVAPEDTRYAQEIVRDVLLLGAALVVARWPRSWLSVDGLLHRAHQRPPADDADDADDLDDLDDADDLGDLDHPVMQDPAPTDAAIQPGPGFEPDRGKVS